MTLRQQKFCDEYIICGNATEAAIKAGYSQKNARNVASEILAKPYIREYIDQRLAEIKSSKIADAEEVLSYLTSVMRGEHTEEIPILCGDGVQELTAKEVGAKERLKAAEMLGKVTGLFAAGGAPYGKNQREEDPLTKSLREEAARLDAE